ncbi:uncharacterized protein PG986_013901 [Apiospora aurea]|uniref:Protein kinase domain-containing protein n=1 Tax=Apiospora aurea TaxID=335848 RepID=A0ABR1PWX2_9PEZI
MITGNVAHDLSVMLKLVDFGAWETSEGPNRNIFDIACLMIELIFMIPDGASKVFQTGPKQVPAVPLGEPLLTRPAGTRPNVQMIESYAEFLYLNPYQSAHFQPGGMLAGIDPRLHAHRQSLLDPDLKNLLTQCLASNDRLKPPLPVLLAWAQTCAAQRTPETYRDWWEQSRRTTQPGLSVDTSIYQLWGETDDGLRQVIQTCIFDATAAKEAKNAERDAAQQRQRGDGGTPEAPESAARYQRVKSASTGHIIRRRENTRQFYSR